MRLLPIIILLLTCCGENVFGDKEVVDTARFHAGDRITFWLDDVDGVPIGRIGAVQGVAYGRNNIIAYVVMDEKSGWLYMVDVDGMILRSVELFKPEKQRIDQ